MHTSTQKIIKSIIEKCGKNYNYNVVFDLEKDFFNNLILIGTRNLYFGWGSSNPFKFESKIYSYGVDDRSFIYLFIYLGLCRHFIVLSVGCFQLCNFSVNYH